METNKILELIKRTRKEKKLTQEDMANHLGIAQGYYSNMENGKNSIDIEKLQEICKVLDIELIAVAQNLTAEEIRENIDLIEKALSNLKSFFKI